MKDLQHGGCVFEARDVNGRLSGGVGCSVPEKAPSPPGPPPRRTGGGGVGARAGLAARDGRRRGGAAARCDGDDGVKAPQMEGIEAE